MENKEKSLEDQKLKHVSGGVGSYQTAKCKKCGADFERYTGAFAGIGPGANRFFIHQRFCPKCAEEKIKNDPSCHDPKDILNKD